MKKLSEGRERLRLEAGLDDFNVPLTPDDQPPAKVLVITCSESTVLSAFVASFDPLCSLENLGGTLPIPQSLDDDKSRDDNVGWGTVDYALSEMGLRRVVLCGHSECCIPATWEAHKWAQAAREFSVDAATGISGRLEVAAELPAFKHASQLWLVEQIRRMDTYVADRTCYCEDDIRIHAMWFDEDRHQVLVYPRDERRFVPLDRHDFEILFNVLRADRGKA